jgi:hypothetical protein
MKSPAKAGLFFLVQCRRCNAGYLDAYNTVLGLDPTTDPGRM